MAGTAPTMVTLDGVARRYEVGGSEVYALRDVVLEAIDLDSSLWHPTFEEGELPEGREGIVLARKAADDLGVGVGDTITLTHPVRTADGFTRTETSIEVAGIHPSPFRFDAYIDRSQLAGFGATDAANAAYLLPARGASVDQVERELFASSSVSSVQPVSVTGDVIEDSLEDFTGIFRVLELFILGLAVLIAYNATSINSDERARERATLFAFACRCDERSGSRRGRACSSGCWAPSSAWWWASC